MDARQLVLRADVESLVTVYDTFGDELYAYCWSLLGDQDTASGAVLDTLLVATEAAEGLRHPGRFRSWLFALARNECLRRRADHNPPPVLEEMRELAGRHGFEPVEVAAVLGVPVDDIRTRAEDCRRRTDRLRPLPFHGAPPDLRRALVGTVSAADVEAVRTSLARRARPFDPEGFPVPLDRRRISGSVLAWCTAAAVLIALTLLVVLPAQGATGGPGSAVAVREAAAPSASDITPAASTPNGADPASPIGGVAPTTADPTSTATAESTAAAAEPTTGRPTAPATPSRSPLGGTAATAPAGTTAPAEDTAGPVEFTLASRAIDCGRGWTAAVSVAIGGVSPSAVSAVTVTWFDPRSGRSRTVSLRRGAPWSGELSGLPTRNGVYWAATATLVTGDEESSGPRRLTSPC